MTDYFVNHPFYMVSIGTFLFMFFMYRDVYKWSKHQKHAKEIEEKKKKRAIKS
jgi:hypothetical protein